MLKKTVRSGVLVVLATAALGNTSCVKHAKGPTMAQRVQQAHGQTAATETFVVTVDSVDPDGHTVTLRDEQGVVFTVNADSPSARNLRPNDKVEVVYEAAVEFALEDPKHPGPGKTMVEESAQPHGERGVQLGRKVRTTVQVVSVAPKGAAVEFRLPDGPVRTVAIDDTENQHKIEALRPGDSVRVTYTEKLALAVSGPKETY
jgi:ribosomal protein S1